MVSGLQVDVKSAELKKILEERLNYHTEKAGHYTKSAEELRVAMKDIENDMSVGKVSHSNPAQVLETQAKTHRDSCAYYKFMLEHVIQDDVYRLAQEDLRRLGIIASY